MYLNEILSQLVWLQTLLINSYLRAGKTGRQGGRDPSSFGKRTLSLKTKLLKTSQNVSNHFSDAAQKMKFSIKDFFSKYDQIRNFLRIWSHLLKKSLMENFIFCAVWLEKCVLEYFVASLKWNYLNSVTTLIFLINLSKSLHKESMSAIEGQRIAPIVSLEKNWL